MPHMKILLIGDNQYVEILARDFAQHQHDVYIIGLDTHRLKHLQETIDCQVFFGNPCDPQSLEALDAHDAQAILSVADEDNTNIIATLLGKNIFHIPLSACCLHSGLYAHHQTLLPFNSHQHLTLNPNKLLAKNLHQLLESPGCHEVVNLLDNTLLVVNLAVQESFYACGKTLADIHATLPSPGQVLAVVRQEKSLPLTKTTTLQPGDHLIFSQAREDCIIPKLTGKKQAYRRIMITGASEITAELLEQAQNPHWVITLIEGNLDQATHFAERFQDITVIHSDPNNTSTLESENIEETDVFLALGQDDEDNLVSALQAKAHAVPFIATLTSQPSLIPIIEKNAIHAALSPPNLVARRLYHFVENPHVLRVQPLRKHLGEILVMEIRSHLDQICIKDLELPPETIFFGLQRQGTIEAVDGKTLLKTGDTLCLYLRKDTDHSKTIALFSGPNPS